MIRVIAIENNYRYENEIKNNRNAARQDEDARQEHRSSRTDLQERSKRNQHHPLCRDDTQASLGTGWGNGEGLSYFHSFI